MGLIKICKACKFGIDYGESPVEIWCERGKRRKRVNKADVCEHWEQATYLTGAARVDKIRGTVCS